MVLYLNAEGSDWFRSEMYASRQAGERVGDAWAESPHMDYGQDILD